MNMHFILLSLLFVFSCNMNSITEINEEIDPIKLNYLALGDNYTIGERVGEEERCSFQLINSKFTKPHKVGNYKIIAITGWTTRNLLDAMDNVDLKVGDYDFMTLLIGVNNQFQGKPISQYETEYTDLMDRVISLLNADANVEKLIVASTMMG